MGSELNTGDLIVGSNFMTSMMRDEKRIRSGDDDDLFLSLQ
jgi:hypothetical protein